MRAKFKRSGPTTVRIKGKAVNILVAKITYRCQECLSKLRRKNAGLVCRADETHRGFVHRSEAEELARERAEELAEVEAAYEIIDGQIVWKGSE